MKDKKDNEFVINGPAEFEMSVHIKNEETGQTGKVTIGLGAGRYPDPKVISERLEKFENNELCGVAPGFVLCSRKEFLANLVEEKTGERVFFAGPDEWDSINYSGGS